MVPSAPVTLDVLDLSGAAVRVNGRGELSSPPMTIVGPHGVDRVTGWAGPWPADERWWDPDARRRRARFQLSTSRDAYLVALADGRWQLDAVYD